MACFPNEEEEFELMYGVELELLNERQDELDHTAGPKSRKSLDFSIASLQKNTTQVINKSQNEPQPSTSTTNIFENSFDRDFKRLEHDQEPNHKKRNFEDLFGDIDDILLEENCRAKKKRSQDDDAALIERILQARERAKEKQNPNIAVGSALRVISSEEHLKENVSFRVPRYPFIALTRHDGERIYIRMHSEEYELEDIRRIGTTTSLNGLMGRNAKEMWTKANAILNKRLEEANQPASNEVIEVEETDNSKLWVDMYKPRKYIELLSDESANRTLLQWLKLWDKIVFNRRPKIRKKFKPNAFSSFNQRQIFKKELDVTLDEYDRPKYKVALLCGPPGLGKTTLAHMVAKHAGYNVVEINASDERNTDSFKTALESSTQMKSVIDREGRPNCLVFDEIDGAPAASIEFLIKFINGIAPKSKKGKKQTPHILKRPIICICNDVYVPALRPLRQIAFVLNFPPISSNRLAERLLEIAKKQNIKTDKNTMMTLSEKTNNDIRSCLSILHFFKTKNKPVTLSEIYKASIGQKDMQRGLFSVWQDIFELNRGNLNQQLNENESAMSKRMKHILSTVLSFGDYERLMQGVFENFPLIKQSDTSLASVREASEWFCYTDCLSKKVQESQNYSLSAYLPYGFVAWHFAFSTYNRPRIIYPTAGYDANVKLTRHNAVLTEVLRDITPQFRSYVNAEVLRLDILPLLSVIMSPSLRTLNVSFYATDEKEKVINVVNIMIDYNLTYVQERTLEGSYIYKIDPNIDEIVNFEGLNTQQRDITYTTKQMIAREIELEKLRRVEKVFVKENVSTKEKVIEERKNEENGMKEVAPQAVVPNHLQRLQIKAVKPKEQVARDFFGRIIAKPTKPKYGDNTHTALAGNIWFLYKEGYSNAVKRKVKMKNLF